MPDITWPVKFYPKTYNLDLVPNVRLASSGGARLSADLKEEYWVVNMTIDDQFGSSAAELEALLAKMSNQNPVVLPHFVNPVPRGTMAGSPTVTGSVLKYATAFDIQTTAGATLKAGDYFTVNGQLLQVLYDSTANGAGVLSVQTVNYVRAAITSGTAVVWNTPTLRYVLEDYAVIRYGMTELAGPSLTLREYMHG